MSLLPSEPDTSAAEESSPRVIGVDSDAADDLIAALSSETAREILAALHDDPAPPARLAERVDTSLQNVQYHLENLSEAGAVEVIDTAYSEKGREMDVYAPADRPLVIFAGESSRTPTLKRALSRLLGGVGVLALASLVVQRLFGGTKQGGFGAAPPVEGPNSVTVFTTDATKGGQAGDATQTVVETATEGGGAPVETTTESAAGTPTRGGVGTVTQTQTPTPVQTPTDTPVETVTETVETVTTTAPDAAEGLPPGALFFAGGLTALVVVTAFWYLWR